MGRKAVSIEYNINGIGMINPVIYPYPKQLYYDTHLDIESRLKDINQLGAIKFIHNGAHYTRFEYVLLQFMMVNFVKNNSQWGLGSEFNFLILNGLEKEKLDYNNKITAAEILELIILFGNMGHFKDTFSSNKVWFHYLFSNKYGIRSGFKKGLKGEGSKLLDKLLSQGNFYKIQWMNSLFILSRKKKLDDYRVICEKIFEQMLNKNHNKWLDIYNKIRKVSYVVLDSHYSHIPISISLQSVLFNEHLFIDELGKYRSGLMETFDRINDLLEDTLYLENNTLLMGTYRSIAIHKETSKFMEHHQEGNSISTINELIFDNATSPFNDDFKIASEEIPWQKDKNLSVTFFIKNKEKFPKDVFQKELDVKDKLGKYIYLSFNFSPDFSKYRTVYSINKNVSAIKQFTESLKIIKAVTDDYLTYKEPSSSEASNGPLQEVVFQKVITYTFRNLLNNDYFCEYKYFGTSSPFIVGKGRKKVMNKVEAYIKEYERSDEVSNDSLHELKAVRASIENMFYKGLIIVYLGSLTFINQDKESLCEIDGVILTPNRKGEKMKIIEAKNYNGKNNSNIARKQLEEKLMNLIHPEIRDDIVIEDLNNYGAQVKLVR